MKRVGAYWVWLILLPISVVGLSASALGAETPPTPASAPTLAAAPAVYLAPTSNAISERGFVVELGTGGLSGAAGGSLALGWGSDRAEGGLAVDFSIRA